MTEPWDIDRFPLKTAAPKSRARQDADDWLANNPEEGMRPVEPGDLDRLTRQHQDDPADRFFGVVDHNNGVSTGYGGGAHYPAGGYNRPDRAYPSTPGEPGYRPPINDSTEDEHGNAWATGSGSFRDPEDYYNDFVDDDEGEDTPDEYHMLTYPRGQEASRHNISEHPYYAFGNAYTGRAEDAENMFLEDNPHADPERNEEATHELYGSHSADQHDNWIRQLDNEEAAHNRVRENGFRRESPDTLGHMAYRRENPNGTVDRVWHNHYLSEPGWQTSHYDPGLTREEQAPWSHHDDRHEDPLGEAMEHIGGPYEQ